MAKPVITPDMLLAAPGARVTCVATGDISPTYWLDEGSGVANQMLPAADGTLIASPLLVQSVEKRKVIAQKGRATGANLQYPLHASQIATAALITNHANLYWRGRLYDGGNRFIIGFQMWCLSPNWYIDVERLDGVKLRYSQTNQFSAGKIIEISYDIGYAYAFYDGNFLWGDAHTFSIIEPVSALFTVVWAVNPGTPQPTPGGNQADFRFSNPILQGTWPLIHMPGSQNMSLNSYNASGGLVTDAEHTAALNSRTWSQQSSGAPEMKFTYPAGNTVKKIRVYYLANGPQTLANSDLVEIQLTGGTTTPLQITSPTAPLTMQPGASVAVVCNYPSSELVYTAGGGGGSFSGSTYTASLNAGNTYFIHVARGGEATQLTVAVPAKITPASVSLVGSTSQAISTNADVTNFASTGWATTGGTLSAKAVRSVTYTAPASVGTYQITAQTAFGTLTTTVTVTASGGTVVSGFRLLPSAGFSVEVGAQVTVDAVSDLSPAIWATLENARVDGANNNLIILDNAVQSRDFIANAFGTEGGTLEWTVGADLANSGSDTHKFGWLVQSASSGINLASPILECFFWASGGNNSWFYIYTSGLRTQLEVSPIDAGTGIRIVVPNPYTGTWQVWLKLNSASSWTQVDSFAGMALPKHVRFQYTPQIYHAANNTVPVGAPILTGRWEKFYPPQWTAILLNAQGQTIGSLPVTPQEAAGASGPNGSFPQQAKVTASAVGSGRVSAQFPSGQTATNIVPITIAQTATPLDVISPATSPVVLNPNEVITVTANYDPALLTYFASGGSFGITPETKNVYTAPYKAGTGNYYFDVKKASEQVRTFVSIRLKLIPSSKFASPGETVYFELNTDDANVTVGATAGTVSLGQFLGGGARQIVYTAPLTAGTFTITADSPAGTTSGTVTVQTQAAIDITNTSADVEPGSQTVIQTNYPAAEVTFSVSPQAGSFAGPIWTAPNTAGRYTITASRAGAGSDTVLLIVPLRITPKNPASIGQSGQIQFTANFSPVTWIVSPGSGSINLAGLYTAPLSSGQYGVSVNATVAGNATSDNALVTVSGAALAVQGPTSITVQPGEQYRILVNYPLSEVNFNATPPGSFGLGTDENLYTAPTDAGTYTAQVARGNEFVNVTFTVPVVLTPAAISLGNSEIQIFSVNADVTNFATTGWTATGGALATPAIRTVQYTAGTTAGTYGITAITNKGTISAVITLTGAAGGALSITYPADPVTMNPSSSITLGFNVPYEPGIVLTATGGTFSGATFTAPQIAGTYTITATKGAQSDTLTVKIPLVVAPSAVVCGPGARTLLTINHPSPAFTVAVGAGSMDGNTFVASHTVASYAQGILVSAIGLTVAVAVVIQSTQLVVYGPQTITLSSGGSYTVSSNVPATAATYMAFGGHFENTNVYVAPDGAGNYYFIVNYEGQQVRIDVHVPLRITPDVARLSAGQTQQFSVNAPSANWSTTAGSIDPVTGFYTAPQTGTVATVTATTPTGSDTAQVLLLEEFPFPASYSVAGEQGRDAIIVKLEDGRRHGRIQGAVFKSYDLHFDNREQEEIETVLDWHRDRYPERPFLFNDSDLSLYVAVVFDSEVRWEDLGECRFNYAFRVLETLD